MDRLGQRMMAMGPSAVYQVSRNAMISLKLVSLLHLVAATPELIPPGILVRR